MAFKCSKCRRQLYNRRRATCEFCGVPLGAALRLSETQRTRIDALKAAEARAHREFIERELTFGSMFVNVSWVPDVGF